MTPDEPTRPQGEGSPDQPHPGQALIPYPYAYPNDEIDLVEVGVSLWRRWKLMAVVFLVVLGLALAFAFVRKPQFEYSAVMRLGTVKLLENGQTLTDPQSAVTQLKQVYIPQVLGEAVAHGIAVARNLEIDVNVEDKSQAVALSTKSHRKDGPTVRHLLERIVGAASVSINSRITSYVARNRAYLKQQIEALRDRENALQAQVARLSHGAGEGAAAASYVATEVAALTQQEARLRQELDVTMPSNVEQAGLVGGVSRSVKQAGLGRAVIAILGAVAGVILALLAAAAANYTSAVRRRMSHADGAGHGTA